MKSRLAVALSVLLAACGGGEGGGSSATSAASAVPASGATATVCPGGPFTTDATKICTDASGKVVTAYVYAQPQTVIADGTVISSDTTWPASGSPYYIAGTMQVAKGAMLSIPDNVIVEGMKPVPSTADCIGQIPTQGIINGCRATECGRQQSVSVARRNGQQRGSERGRRYGQHPAHAAPGRFRPDQSRRAVLDDLQPGLSPERDADRSRRGTTYEAGTNGYPSFKNATLTHNTFVDSAAFAFDYSIVMQNNLFVNMVDSLVLIDDFPASGAPTDIAKQLVPV